MQTQDCIITFLLITGIAVIIIYTKIYKLRTIEIVGFKTDESVDGPMDGFTVGFFDRPLPPKRRIRSKHTKDDIEVLWTYVCSDGHCKRVLYKTGKRITLKTCNMMCDLPQLWPYPKSVVHDNRSLTKFCIGDLRMEHNATELVANMLQKAYKYVQGNLKRLAENLVKKCKLNLIRIMIRIGKDDHKLLLNTNEEYNLTITQTEKQIVIDLVAETYFGARHGLETFYQLIWWDNIENSLFLLTNVNIFDGPAFSYRGLMLDTGNNYFSVKSIIRTLKGMSSCKMNVFHWHITDFSSFPFQSPSYPELSQYGAYEESKIYTQNDVKRIVTLARSLGIRVVIEIDAPGHMLAGWEAMEGDFVVFLRRNVTGQLNPRQKKVFNVLKKLHEEIIDLTEEEELFHIGGHTHQKVRNESHRKENYKTIQSIYGNLKELDRTKYTILWSSDFTQSDSFNFDPKNTIIQISGGGFSLAHRSGYGVIFSEEPYWSLGCGLGVWTPLKMGRCYEYSTWQNVYLRSPWLDYDFRIVYGGEVTLWTEQVGEDTLDNILWPRTAAFAENIWRGGAFYEVPPDVFTRLDSHRERLERLSLDPSVLWPEWCTLNPRGC